MKDASYKFTQVLKSKKGYHKLVISLNCMG